MRKDNVWKEMKDSDIAVLWFLISIPEWEQRKKFLLFMTTTHFIRCLWARSFLQSPGIFYLFSSIACGCWSKEKHGEHLWFPQPLGMRLQESSPKSQQLSRGWSWSCPMWGSQRLLKLTFGFVFKHSSLSLWLLKLHTLLKFAVVHWEHILLSNLLVLFWKQVALNLSLVV